MKLSIKNLFSGISSGRIMVYLIILLIATIVVMGVTYSFIVIQETKDREYINRIGDQRVLSQELAKLASQALEPIFKLSLSYKKIVTSLMKL